jgi:hypothetical protein
MEPALLELFHRGADPASEGVRGYIEDYALEDRVRLRDVALPEAEADFHRLGGKTTPALWDGTHLHQGTEGVLARLQAVVNLGRDT